MPADKRTGEILGSVPLPAPGQYGMMTYMHRRQAVHRRADWELQNGLSRLAGGVCAAVIRVQSAGARRRKRG